MKRALVLFLALAACGEDPLDIPEGCQPLYGGTECFLPYPSDFFRDPASGELRTTGKAKLRSIEGVSADITDHRPHRGFSRLPPITALIGSGVSRDRFVGAYDDYLSSTDPKTSRSLIIEAATGQLVPHFADFDPHAESDAERALVLHTVLALKENTRYVVALHDLGVEAPEGFRRLRDDESDERYEEQIFPVIEGTGVQRDSVFLAWDFTTGADEDVTRDLWAIREQVIAAATSTTPRITITAVEESDGSDGVWRLIRGTVRGPLFLENDEPGESPPLVRDAAGVPTISGETEIGFVIVVPQSLRDSTRIGQALLYGHGFFGSRREVEKSSPIMLANRLNAVLFSIDWFGMTMHERLGVLDGLVTRPSQSLSFIDGVHQAYANWIVMAEAIRGPLSQLPALRGSLGTTVYEPSKLAFLGISQGHILGGTFAAVVPDVDRVILNVGGAGFTHFMLRARPFSPFLELLKSSLPSALDRQKYIGTLQREFDRIDPATWAPRVFDDPDRRVLLQVGLGDAEVPDIGGMLHARLLNAGLAIPTPLDVFNLAPLTHQPAGLTLYDFGIDRSETDEAKPPLSYNEVHEGVRLLEPAIQQMSLFLANGSLERVD
jgi:hypothetical protein